MQLGIGVLPAMLICPGSGVVCFAGPVACFAPTTATMQRSITRLVVGHSARNESGDIYMPMGADSPGTLCPESHFRKFAATWIRPNGAATLHSAGGYHFLFMMCSPLLRGTPTISFCAALMLWLMLPWLHGVRGLM